MFKVKNMSKTSAQIQVSMSTCDLGIPLVGEGVSPTCLFGDIKNCTRSPAKPAKMPSLRVPGMMGMTRLEAEITSLSLSLHPHPYLLQSSSSFNEQPALGSLTARSDQS